MPAGHDVTTCVPAGHGVTSYGVTTCVPAGHGVTTCVPAGQGVTTSVLAGHGVTTCCSSNLSCTLSWMSYPNLYAFLHGSIKLLSLGIGVEKLQHFTLLYVLADNYGIVVWLGLVVWYGLSLIHI